MTDQQPSQPKEKEPSQTMIYVSNLPFTTTDEQLRELFKGHDIKTAYIAKRRNGRSKGFGFVNLVKDSEQNAAISKVDGKEIDGRKITAKIAFNDPRRNDQGELKEEFKTNLPKQGATSDTVVYVANIPWTFKDEELKNVFAGLDVKLATVATRRNGRSKGFGFVEFGTKEACTEALKKDQLKVLSSDPTPQERIITVRQSHNYRGNQPKENNNQQQERRGGNNNRQGGGGGNNRRRRDNSRGRSRDNNRRPTGNNNQDRNPPRKLENTLYVSNIPFDLDDNDLKQIFSEFHVKSSHVATRQNGKSRGFGFVEFNNAKDQNEALNALNQSEVNNRVITVRVATGQRTNRDDNRGGSDNRGGRGGNRRNNSRGSNNRGGDNNRGGNNRRNENRERNNQQPREPREPREPSTTMVYVSNLPFSVDDNELSGIFKGLKITNGYVSKRRNGASRGYGFVTFASNEEQLKALKFNGTEISGRPVVVQVANKPTTPTTPTTESK